METILVTGAAGFIASHLSEALLEKGHKVIGIDNLHPYYDIKQKEANLEILKKYPNFTFYKADLRYLEELKEVFSKHKFDRIAHIGGNGGVRASLEDPEYYQETIVGGTTHLLRLGNEQEVKNFVFASSSSVYGNRKTVPFKETDNVDNPVSPYAACKKAAELMGYAWHYLYGLNVTCLRFFTVYGPRGRPDMAPFKFVKRISEGTPVIRYGDGSSQRDYTYIADVVKGIVAALERPLGYEIINLGNNKPIALNDFIKTIEEITGKKAIIKEEPMPKADVPITYADISKAKELLDFEPVTQIREGMAKFWEWFK